MNLAALSILDALDLIRRGEVLPPDLSRACLARIEQLNGTINAFITVTPELAQQQSQLAARRSGRRAAGALHGIPVALKDLIHVAGIPTTAGSRFAFAETAAGVSSERDAFVYTKLRAAGAVLLGKLNLHEIALGVTNENPHFGDCQNPWAPAYSCGGSSGGCAAALASEMVFGALGTDTGGSIRIPASLCGVVGLKPTYGRVSLRGVIPLSWHLDHVGPMARRVADAALLFQSIAGYDPADPYAQNVPCKDALSNLRAGVRGWRVALAEDAYFNEADAEVLAAVQQAGRVFEALGAQVERVALPGGREAAAANRLITQADAAAFHRQRLAEHADWFGEDVRQRLQNGAETSLYDYQQARRTQARLRRSFEQFFADYKVLLLPTTPIAAPRRGGDAVERARLLTRFTAPFNLTGLPALSLPCGFTQAGLPIGLQIVSKPWAEAAALRAGMAYEQATDWHLRRPPLLAENI